LAENDKWTILDDAEYVPRDASPNMQKEPFMFRSLVAFSVVTLVAGLLQAAPKTSDSVVKATAVAGKQGQDGKQTIEVTLTIDQGWHLYANPNLAIPGTEVVVKASAGGKDIDAKVEYPKGTPVKDSVGAYEIYEGKVTIKLSVDRSKLGSKPIDLNVQVSACTKEKCLLPGEIKLNVP
jgi:hypothetical protein